MGGASMEKGIKGKCGRNEWLLQQWDSLTCKRASNMKQELNKKRIYKTHPQASAQFSATTALVSGGRNQTGTQCSNETCLISVRVCLTLYILPSRLLCSTGTHILLSWSSFRHPWNFLLKSVLPLNMGFTLFSSRSDHQE